jgi:CRISPR/Cas system CSM-associated protein Csm2 small subunit
VISRVYNNEGTLIKYNGRNLGEDLDNDISSQDTSNQQEAKRWYDKPFWFALQREQANIHTTSAKITFSYTSFRNRKKSESLSGFCCLFCSYSKHIL